LNLENFAKLYEFLQVKALRVFEHLFESNEVFRIALDIFASVKPKN